MCAGVAGALLAASVSCTGMACHRDMGQAPAIATASSATVFANTKCPIMGTPIDPAKVPESLTRTYKDQKIAFCCPMCLPQWDKLTDAQKDTKLQAAK
jgi:hypothetical protein